MSSWRLPAAGGEHGLGRLLGRHGLALGTAVAQVPALVALVVAWPWLLLLVPVAGLATRSTLGVARGIWAVTPRSRAHLYLVVWPFFAWWVACAAFAALLPGAGLVALVSPLSAGASLGGAGVLAALVGLASVRRRPRVVRVTLAFADLPPALDGYRIAQLSDIHCGPFASETQVGRWVARTNRLGADLVAVTGDLIDQGLSHVEPVARALGRLRARDGVYACMGNHDYYEAGEPLVDALARGGIRVLRNGTDLVTRGDARLAIAGVDDTWIGRARLDETLAQRPADAFTVLLAHDPDVFAEVVKDAARRRVALTLSGHTHGGQLAVPFLSRRYNLARLLTRFTAGLYREAASVLYVNRGLGTTGPPIRIGSRAEITLFTIKIQAILHGAKED